MKVSQRGKVKDQEPISPDELLINMQNISEQIGKHQFTVRNQRSRRRLSKQQIKTTKSIAISKQNRQQWTKRPNDTHGLKKIIKEQKIKTIIRNFINKIRRNNTGGQPISFEPFEEEQKKNWLEKQGYKLPDTFQQIWALINILQLLTLIIFYTLSIVFDKVRQSQIVTSFQQYSLFFYSLEIFGHFTTVRFADGKKLITLKQISKYYLKTQFPIDIISLTILFFDVFIRHQIMVVIRLFIILKTTDALKKFESLQNSFIDNFYKEQYWGLIKVFLLNFIFAHFLAIFLIAMADISNEDSWIVQKGIQNKPWNQVYIWAYYWATNIMLTVGFGDISATNHNQAFCLILIQTISCIALAYNINCVGNLISNIRSQDIQKNKNYKVFNKLSQKNNIPDELNWKINNFIEESTNIKKKFNFQQENAFISKLPFSLKADFLKESNKKIFQGLVFFKNLTEKSLLNFAEQIQMRICHPEEIIQKKDDQYNLIILKQGHVGFISKKTGSDHNQIVINQIKINQKQQPFLLSLDFISLNKPNYEMKSLEYTILYWLNYSQTVKLLQNGQLDYQHYCQLRDKSRHIIDEYEVFLCDICGGHHTKFSCPKLHFIPIQQHVIFKHLQEQKSIGLERFPFSRKKRRYIPLRKYKKELYREIEQQNKKNKRRNGKRELAYRSIDCLIRNQKNQSTNNIKEEQKQTLNQQALVLKCIRQEFQKIEKKQDLSVWGIECDELRNFKYYFKSDNPSALDKKYPGF